MTYKIKYVESVYLQKIEIFITLKKFINNTLSTNVYSDNLCKFKYACTYTLEN